ncbi:MAG: hypothetical protein ACOYKE_14370 [Ferruginibacter sp.]
MITMSEQLVNAILSGNEIFLPEIGSLQLNVTPASTDFLHSKIVAPAARIEFTPGSFHFSTAWVLKEEATSLLAQLHHNGSANVAGIGTFEQQADKGIKFSAIPLNPAFFPDVTAERVIHQDAVHTMLVGDKETTNEVMTEYYNEEVVVADRWWIAAILLAAAGIGAIALYLSGNNAINSFPASVASAF